MIRFVREVILSYRLLQVLLAAAAIVIVAAPLIFLWSWVTPDRDNLWIVETVDRFVLVGIAGLILVAFVGGVITLLLPEWPWGEWFRKDAVQVGTALAILLTLYVAYSTFRNQSRLTAELALNEESMGLYDIEMNRPELRCLYFNYGFQHSDACLVNLVSSEEKWSLAIFYVEESWFILTRAYEDRANWGSNYATSIAYWAQDVSRDPSGLFSYYLIMSSSSLAAARETMRQADVAIANPCEKFRRVWDVLGGANQRPDSVSGAAAECGVTGLPIYEVRD